MKSKIYKAFLILLPISIILNIIFIVMVTQNQTMKKDYYLTQVNYPLYELNLVIQNQVDNGWKEPQLVTYQLDKVRNNILDSTFTNNFANDLLDENEKLLLNKVYNYLKHLPKNDLFAIGTWSESDNEYLLKVGEALKISNYVSYDLPEQNWDNVMKQWELLAKELDKQFKN